VGVSCSAHRNLRGFIDRRGVFLEDTVADPASLEGFAEALRPLEMGGSGSAKDAPAKDIQPEGISEKTVQAAFPHISLEEGVGEALKAFSHLSVGDRALLSGKILVARDAAHARWSRIIDEGGELPAYVARYPICYAGPSETPPGRVTGSFGPTTAGRMDSYAELLMSRGAALITIAKGNRSTAWAEACAKWGAVYLGTIGGAAALIADEHIVSSEVIDYPELGMEAVRLVEIRNLPVFVLIDGKGMAAKCSAAK
jgi:fumarate hydratase class I